MVLAIGETYAFKKYGSKLYTVPFPGCEHKVMYTDDYLECLARHYTATIYHYSGTAKMGPYWDKEAVVNPELK